MLRSALALVVLFVAAGCGGGASGPPTAPISGKVTLDGQPLEGAIVNFTAQNYVGSGRTGADGAYTLATGAALGENKVWIEKRIVPEGFQGEPEEGMDAGQLEAANLDIEDPAKKKVKVGQLIPADYSDPGKSILKFTVSDGGSSSADFALTSGS